MGEDRRSGDSWLDAGVEERSSRTRGVWPSPHDLDCGVLSTMQSWNVVLTMVGVLPNTSAKHNAVWELTGPVGSLEVFRGR